MRAKLLISFLFAPCSQPAQNSWRREASSIGSSLRAAPVTSIKANYRLTSTRGLARGGVSGTSGAEVAELDQSGTFGAELARLDQSGTSELAELGPFEARHLEISSLPSTTAKTARPPKRTGALEERSVFESVRESALCHVRGCL